MNWNTIENERLIDSIMSAETPDQIRRFLDDLMLESELKRCVQRLNAAYLLSLFAPYTFIVKSTGLSSTTISRISKKLADRRGGFRETLKRLNPHGARYFD